MARGPGGSVCYREHGHQRNVRGRGEGTAVAIFVTLKDKLGYTLSATPMILYVDGPLYCKIKAL